MALTGIHVLCTSVRTLNGASLTSLARWSETLSSPGTTTQVSPANEQCFEISAGVDAYVAVGPTPDASQAVASTSSSARTLIRAGETRNLFGTQGDKIAWVAA